MGACCLFLKKSINLNPKTDHMSNKIKVVTYEGLPEHQIKIMQQENTVRMIYGDLNNNV